MIKFENVKKIYNTRYITTNALDGVNLTINDGELVAVIGPSGSGKSTLLNIIGCMDTVTDGKCFINGVEINKLKGIKLDNFRKNNISFIFQHFALMENYTVLENVEMPLICKNVPKKVRRKAALDSLKKLGIEELKDKYPNEISGGQMQRCAIARAVTSGNGIILADEPTGALDQAMGREVMELLKDINSSGTTVIIVTHDINVAKQADRIIQIVDGKIVNHND